MTTSSKSKEPFKFTVANTIGVIIVIGIIIYLCVRWFLKRRRLRRLRGDFTVMRQDNTETWITHKLTDDFNEIRSLAVLGGHDSDNDEIFIGRSFKHGDWLTTKVIPKKNLAFVCWNGKEIYVDHFDLLCGNNFIWKNDRNGNVPLNAVSPGLNKDGEKLYIGRGQWYGSLTPGKIHPSHHCLYIPYHGKEIRIESYEVLCKVQHGPPQIGFQLDSMTDFNINHRAPVVVTSSTHTTATAYATSAGGGYHEAPYPTANASYAMPLPTAAATGHINTPYPNSAPYPTHVNMGMPMPQTTGSGYPNPQTGFQTSPYPPPTNSDPQANPPSYDQVVGNTAPYNKQSAYNPHYSG